MLDCDPIDDAPVLDLRIRKGVRRHGVRLAVASARPTRARPQRRATCAHAPGGGAALLVALDAALAGDDGNLGGAATAAGSNAQAVRDLAGWLRDAGEDLVIVYGERRADRGAARGRCSTSPAGSGSAAAPAPGCSRSRRCPTRAACARRASLPGHGPGYATVAIAEPGRDARGIADGARLGRALDRLAQLRRPAALPPGPRAVGAGAGHRADRDRGRQRADRHACASTPTSCSRARRIPEKEGTLTNLDGRVQRLRLAIGRPKGRSGMLGSGVRPGWQVIAERRAAVRDRPRRAAGAMASAQLFDAVPFYAGLTLDEIGGRGVRWPETARRSVGRRAGSPRRSTCRPAAPAAARRRAAARHVPQAVGAKEVDVSPVLQFLRPRQVVELSPADAAALGMREGDRVEVGTNGTRSQRR